MEAEERATPLRWAIWLTSVLVIGTGALLLMVSLPDQDSKKTTQIYSELLGFKRAAHYYIGMDRVPPSTLEEFLADYKEPGLRYVRSGRDPWGNPFYYNIRIVAERDIERAVETTFELTIRSKGPNGRDESGKGDDIQVVHSGIVIHNRLGTSKPSQSATRGDNREAQ